MTARLTFLLLVLSIFSCNRSTQTDSTSLNTTDSTSENVKKTQNSNIETATSNTNNCVYSNEFNEIITLLQQADYNIDSTLTEDTLQFKIRDRLEVVKSYDFAPESFKCVFATRKTRLKGMKDNWYPSFRVYEICFNNEQEAIDYEEKLTEVLSSHDIFNDKNYDYLVRNHDRIIYVTCVAKIFEQYAFEYRETIEKIIKN